MTELINDSTSSDADAKESVASLQNHYEEMPALCLLVDDQLRIKKINRFACQQLGYELAELLDSSVDILCAENDRAFFTDKLAECLNGDGSSLNRMETVMVRKNYSQYWVRHTVRMVPAEQNAKQLIIVSEDITETRYLINELERQNAMDSLTGLCSRRRFDRELEQALLTAKASDIKHTLCFIDLDQFKVVNDTCGHHAGDELLRKISGLFSQTIRSNDVLARLGGDEFGLILHACSIHEAKAICEKILLALTKQRFRWEGEVFTIGASIGILEMGAESAHASELLRQVDSACYMAKDKGRNCIQVYCADDREMRHRGQLMRWLSRLHAAFETDRFELHLQAILPVQSNKPQTAFYEVLVRMRDADGILIMPGSFIPAAEYYNLASRLDMWVTRNAISLAKRVETVRDQHLSITDHAVSVDTVRHMYFINISGLTMGSEVFIAEITELLKQCDNLAFDICFEITETVAIQNLKVATRFIEHFKGLGCFFALDDFGSGFSSFSYLSALPVDFIKIDGEFIRNICDGSTELAVVKAIHEVALAFGKQTIAEHIEDQQILEHVASLGVDFAQGFHLDRPAPMLQKFSDTHSEVRLSSVQTAGRFRFRQSKDS